MDKLAEIRSQELICLERALSDTDRRAFWLMKAEEWAQRALDEITSQFDRDRFTDTVPPQLREGLCEQPRFVHAPIDSNGGPKCPTSS